MYPVYNCITRASVSLMYHFRMLWEQHTAWTRMAIMSMVFELPDEEFSVKRLLQNPIDFANAFRPFYGDRLANRFGQLLTEHLTIAAELVKASKAGDSQKSEDAERRWYRNGDEIAVFLGSINPYWSEEDWRRMYRVHLDLVKSEAVDLLSGNYQKSIETYDKLEIQALEMADVMVNGIIAQFAYYFCY